MYDPCEHRNPTECWLTVEQRRVLRFCVMEVVSRRTVRGMNDESLLRELFHFRAWNYAERLDPLADAISLAGAVMHLRTAALHRLDKYHDLESLLDLLDQRLEAAALTTACGERGSEVVELAITVANIRTGYALDAATRGRAGRIPLADAKKHFISA